MMKPPTGIILYEGPSELNGKPIVVIANKFGNRNENKKTGAMIDTWILNSEDHPCNTRYDDEDIRICGDCKHREMRSCYVNMLYGPISVWNAYQRGTYLNFSPELLPFFQNKPVRVGSYGDPAAVPMHVWDMICNVAPSYTGYTHQWKNKKFEGLKQYCMASCDTHEEYELAKSLGWRSFRVRLDNDGVFESEVVCPASAEKGKKSSCSKCGLCKGLSSRSKKDVVIKIHGNKGVINKFKRGIRMYREKIKQTV